MISSVRAFLSPVRSCSVAQIQRQRIQCSALQFFAGIRPLITTIIITDLYSAFRSEDTEALVFQHQQQSLFAIKKYNVNINVKDRRAARKDYGNPSCWSPMLTGSALALHCCKVHAKVNRKIENSSPCKIVTHEDINLKLGTRDYVVDITYHATFESNRSSGGFPPNRGNITLLWLFCCPAFFHHAPRSNRRTDSYAEWLKRCASAYGRSFWGSRRWVTSHGENMPQNFQKGA